MGLCKLVQMRGVGAHYSPLAKAMLMDTKWSAVRSYMSDNMTVADFCR